MNGGVIPEDLTKVQKEKYVDENGNPIIDKEGGAIVQPQKGFVIKTKDLNSGVKIFINITSHDLIEPIGEKSIPAAEAVQYGAAETGLRIPLSLGNIREERDKKDEAVQTCDFIFNIETVQRAQKQA